MTHQYSLLPGDSEIRILIYRAGLLSKLAHNHVVVSHHCEGEILWDRENPAATKGQLQVPLDSLSVDLEEHRHQIGGDFETYISPSDVTAVTEKMLGYDILDAAHYPWVKAEITGAEGNWPNFTLQTLFTIRDVTHPLAIPFTVVHEDHPWKAYGEFYIWQSHFGIKPSQFMMGTVKVQDRLTLRFVINQTRIT